MFSDIHRYSVLTLESVYADTHKKSFSQRFSSRTLDPWKGLICSGQDLLKLRMIQYFILLCVFVGIPRGPLYGSLGGSLLGIELRFLMSCNCEKFRWQSQGEVR
jgi:hypothetical protein